MAEETLSERADDALEPSHELISSRRVEGTSVCNPAGEKLGTIHSVMIEKRKGRIAYAVLSFGGLFGFGEKVHPIPWELLAYDVDREAYVVDIDRARIESAPAMMLDEGDRPIDKEYQEEVHRHWGTMPWWGL